MELIEDEDKEEGALPEPEPRHRTERPADDNSGRPRWLAPLVLLIITAGVIVGLVFLARWIYHEANNDNAPAASSNKSRPAAGAPKSQPGVGGSSAAKSSSGAASSGQTGGAGSHKQIANTGPGNVVAIFIGASLAAAGLHFVINLRRFNKDGA